MAPPATLRTMIQAGTRAELGAALAHERAEGRTIALVPTMGYLHDGHLGLVRSARENGDVVVMSVFVNPLQFGPGEDLDKYPRNLVRDAELAERAGVDILFVPDVAEVYPSGSQSILIEPGDLADRLCGHFRPGHFTGVLTVVAKLFNMVAPDVAVFGQKDFQQLALIRRMVSELDMPLRIVGGPIVREPDGLAMSSRNVYLDESERVEATLLHAALEEAQRAFAAGERDAAALRAIAGARLDTGAHMRTQYIETVSATTLDPVATVREGDVMALAAFVGRTRLIDNHVFGAGPR